MPQLNSRVEISEPKISKFFFADTRFAWFWLVVRIYVGWQWFHAGWEKLHSSVWVGAKAGVAIQGFLMGAVGKASGPHPDVQSWYGDFVSSFALHHTIGFSYLITYGELLVGIALILGLFTGIAAFFGSFMNMNYLLAGTVSTNPILFILQLFLILAWRIAGWFGLDRYILSALGTPWQPGKIFKK
jgi:thiosulfate dehydrogenase [quinone] large subunit